jgi:hypothetical protein
MVGLFIIGDTFLGIYVAYKLKIPIISRKLARLVTKLFFYTGAILLVYALDVYLLSMFVPDLISTKLGAGVLSSIEIFSMDEKVRKINHNRGFLYYFKRFIKGLKDLKESVNGVIN